MENNIKMRMIPENGAKKYLNRYEQYFSESGDLVLSLEDAISSAMGPLDLLEVYLDEAGSTNGFTNPEERLRFVVGLVSTTLYQVKNDMEYVLQLSGKARELGGKIK